MHQEVTVWTSQEVMQEGDVIIQQLYLIQYQ